MLAGCSDGSVWWYDLDLCSSPRTSDPAVQPHLLLKLPLPASGEGYGSIHLSIDHTSEELTRNDTEHFKVLEHFNLAVVVDWPSVTPIQVWRVNVNHGAETNSPTALQAHQCLSSFFENPIYNIHSVSLHGDHLAYSFRVMQEDITVIVDWRSVNGKNGGSDLDFMGWHLQLAYPMVSPMTCF